MKKRVLGAIRWLDPSLSDRILASAIHTAARNELKLLYEMARSPRWPLLGMYFF